MGLKIWEWFDNIDPLCLIIEDDIDRDEILLTVDALITPYHRWNLDIRRPSIPTNLKHRIMNINIPTNGRGKEWCSNCSGILQVY